MPSRLPATRPPPPPAPGGPPRCCTFRSRARGSGHDRRRAPLSGGASMTETDQSAGTRIPRWSQPGAATGTGVAQFRTAVPAPLAAALRAVATAQRVDLGVLLLAAHLKVLAAVSGE